MAEFTANDILQEVKKFTHTAEQLLKQGYLGWDEFFANLRSGIEDAMNVQPWRPRTGVIDMGACATLQRQYDGEIAAYQGYTRDAANLALSAEEKREFLRIANDELNDHSKTEQRLMQARGCP